jgi:hypothetical protein
MHQVGHLSYTSSNIDDRIVAPGRVFIVYKLEFSDSHVLGLQKGPKPLTVAPQAETSPPSDPTARTDVIFHSLMVRASHQ